MELTCLDFRLSCSRWNGLPLKRLALVSLLFLTFFTWIGNKKKYKLIAREINDRLIDWLTDSVGWSSNQNLITMCNNININPFIPKVSSVILLSVFRQFLRCQFRDLVLDQLINPQLIFFYTIMTCLLDIALILWGEILSRSLMGGIGLNC